MAGVDQRADFGGDVLVPEQRLVRAEDGRLGLTDPRGDRVVDVAQLLARGLQRLRQVVTLGGRIAVMPIRCDDSSRHGSES